MQRWQLGEWKISSFLGSAENADSVQEEKITDASKTELNILFIYLNIAHFLLLAIFMLFLL